jgi:hypothetical protein
MTIRFNKLLLACLIGVVLIDCPALRASDDLLIYSDQRNNGWGDWGWVPHYTTNNTVHSGSNAMVFAASSSYQAWWLKHNPIDTSLYTNLTLWVNGGTNGGQYIGVNGELGGSSSGLPRIGATVSTNSWTKLTFTLASLGVANKTNLTGFQIWNGGTLQPSYLIDDITLVAAPAPSLVHVGLFATQNVRTVDAKIFSVNTAAWDGNLDTAGTIFALTNIDNQALRWPGGSWGDGYHWATEVADRNARGYGVVTTNFTRIATNTRAQVFIIANYGSGTPAEAAGWVRQLNITNHLGYKYWEVGNENFGSWETDINTNAPWLPHDPWTYAMRFTNYFALMKAADPTVKIGAVVLDDENSYSNNATHFAVNPRTGTTNYGWTPIVLATLNSLGVTPDFVVDHEYAPNDGDTQNLLWSKGWTTTAANIRQMLTDYMGPGSSNVELTVTENGGGGDRQRTSIVGGLFYADSIGQILQTEFTTRLWWDLRNGQSAIANPDPALYGWRTNASGSYIYDEGIIYNVTNAYPTFYCAKLMKYFARGGDTVVRVTNDYALLGTYAVKRTNGTRTLLVINKSSSSNLTASVNFGGWLPATNATIYSYGIPQDEAARTGIGSPDLQSNLLTTAGVNFTNTYAPYSVSVIVFNPAPPSVLAAQNAPVGKFVFQLQGQPGARYVLQSCTNLSSTWTNVSTNTLSGFTQNFTNNLSGVAKFWRAQWLP